MLLGLQTPQPKNRRTADPAQGVKIQLLVYSELGRAPVNVLRNALQCLQPRNYLAR